MQALLRRYARAEAGAVRPFLVGRRVLDLGAGEGYVTAALEDAWVCAADVGAFRRAEVPYVVYDGRRLPFRDASFDTTLLLLVLHHCADAEGVLDEAVRVTRRRLVVIESVYRNRRDHFWLDLLDGRINGFRHDGRMAHAIDARMPDGWRRAFALRGLTILTERWLGAWWERLVHHPLLFVLEPRQLATSRAPEGLRALN